MRALTIGLITAATLGFASLASAQGVYLGAGPGGVGVGVDAGHRYYDDGPRYRRYRTEGYDRYEGVARCHTTVIRRGDGSVTRVRRCRD